MIHSKWQLLNSSSQLLYRNVLGQDFILPYLQANKLIGYYFMMLAKNKEIPGSETKNFVTQARQSEQYDHQHICVSSPSLSH